MIMRPRIALEAPKQSLDLGFQSSDYLFVLAHLWEDAFYRNKVFRYQSEGKKVFLDNSAFELGSSIGFNRYLTIIRELDPDVIVVPDMLGDIANTVRFAKIFYEGLPGAFLSKYKFMVVPQGRNNRERMKCFHILRTFGYPFHIVGLPRHAYPDRVDLMRNIKRFGGKALHFLGLPSFEELKEIQKGDLYSLDTSLVAKYSVGKSGSDVLDFESDVCDVEKFAEGLGLLNAALRCCDCC